MDCRKYLKNETPNKLILLDVPYIGLEKECAIESIDYDKFHRQVADELVKADYPFIYNCRSSAPKSDKTRTTAEKEADMKLNLGMYFFDKG